MRRILGLLVIAFCGFAEDEIAKQDTTRNQNPKGRNKQEKCPRNDFCESGLALPADRIQRSKCCEDENTKNKNECCTDKNRKLPQAYNATAREFACCKMNFDIYGSFIYWKAMEDGLSLAVAAPQVACPDDAGSENIKGVVGFQNFDYNPGFKVGLGIGGGPDDWTFDTVYTWLHQTESQNGVTPSGDCPEASAQGWCINEWFVAGPLACSGECAGNCCLNGADLCLPSFNSSWNLKLDQLDFLLGRPFYQGTRLTIYPNGGLRVLWLRQKENIEMVRDTGSNISSNNRSTSWAVGGVGNINSHWILWRGLRFDTIFGMSLLYTNYTRISNSVSCDQTCGLVPTSCVGEAKQSSLKHLEALRPTMDIGLGLGYGAYFCKKFYMDIAIRYDFNLYWSQNVMRQFVQEMIGIYAPAGDLYLHGLTIDLRFGF